MFPDPINSGRGGDSRAGDKSADGDDVRDSDVARAVAPLQARPEFLRHAIDALDIVRDASGVGVSKDLGGGGEWRERRERGERENESPHQSIIA